jgi:hypothetical protein
MSRVVVLRCQTLVIHLRLDFHLHHLLADMEEVEQDRRIQCNPRPTLLLRTSYIMVDMEVVEVLLRWIHRLLCILTLFQSFRLTTDSRFPRLSTTKGGLLVRLDLTKAGEVFSGPQRLRLK